MKRNWNYNQMNQQHKNNNNNNKMKMIFQITKIIYKMINQMKQEYKFKKQKED